MANGRKAIWISTALHEKLLREALSNRRTLGQQTELILEIYLKHKKVKP